MKNAVCVLITDKDKNILSVSRKDNHNDWGLPGGKLEDNESFLDAAIRETLEETGYSIEIIDVSNYFECTDNDYLVRTYKAKIVSDLRIPVSNKETGIVSFRNKIDLLKGSFSEYNFNCFKHFKL